MRVRRFVAGVVAVSSVVSSVQAEAHHRGGHVSISHVSHRRGPTYFGGAVGGGYYWSGPPYYVTVGADGLPFVIAPWAINFAPFAAPIPRFDFVPLGGPMPAAPRPAPVPVRNAAAKKADAARGGQLVTVGDRLFRAGNLKRATERYEQAARLDPASAAPQVRLAQVALLRGQYAEAASAIRQAVAAEPGWLPRAPLIQAIYGEPSEFNKPIARLESHLLADPTDRDGWLVLGAQLYLSGQTRRAADVFLRLTDRKPDPALDAFLEASTAKR